MDRPYCAVITQSQARLVVPVRWLENKNDKMTRIFYGPNENEIANFNLPIKYFVSRTENAVYNAYIIRFLREYSPSMM